MFRLTVPAALAALLALPAVAQQAETPPPARPAPEAQPIPKATDSNLQADPATISPARKTNCMRDKHVMS